MKNTKIKELRPPKTKVEGPKKYRRKPLVFEAQQFYPGLKPWPAGVTELKGPNDKSHYVLTTLEGVMEVPWGAWIVTGAKGEKWAVQNEIFRASYEPVKKGEKR